MLNEDIKKKIKKIANVFKEWRYIYEKIDNANVVNFGFLNVFCEFLDTYTILLIQKKYNYDVTQDIR